MNPALHALSCEKKREGLAATGFVATGEQNQKTPVTGGGKVLNKLIL